MCKQGFTVIAMGNVVSECVALSCSSPNQHPGLLEGFFPATVASCSVWRDQLVFIFDCAKHFLNKS